MNFLQNIFRILQKKNKKTKALESIKIVDKRKVVTPLDEVDFLGDEDPALKAILNAVWTGDADVYGSLENGKLTIKDIVKAE
jgi:hypothetical protein